jgi:AcrR family transcriptional regulator
LIDVYSTYHPVFQVYPAASSGWSRMSKGSRRVSERIGTKITPRLPTPALLLPVLLRATHYWRAGVGGVSKTRFLDASARTLHRMQHGSIRGVNIGPVVKAPPRRVPAFPVSPSTPDSPKQGRGRDTRATLLKSASAVLPVNGYHGTRVDDIVAHAGVSHGTFYRYFSSKDDVFRVLAEEAATSMFGLVDGFPADPTGADLEVWLGRWFDEYWANGGVISAWQEIEYEDDDLARFSIEVAIVVFDRLCRLVHRRGFGDSVVDGLVLLAVLERVPYSVKMFGRISRAEAVESTAAMIRQGILGVVL